MLRGWLQIGVYIGEDHTSEGQQIRCTIMAYRFSMYLGCVSHDRDLHVTKTTLLARGLDPGKMSLLCVT